TTSPGIIRVAPGARVIGAEVRTAGRPLAALTRFPAPTVRRRGWLGRFGHGFCDRRGRVRRLHGSALAFGTLRLSVALRPLLFCSGRLLARTRRRSLGDGGGVLRRDVVRLLRSALVVGNLLFSGLLFGGLLFGLGLYVRGGRLLASVGR